MSTIITTLLSLASIGLGCFLLYVGWKSYFSTRNMDKWELTQGTITKSDVKRAGAAFIPDVEYQYFVLGVEYKGHSITAPPDVFYQTDEVQEFLAEYPVGRKVDVFYNPEYHEVAIMEKQAFVGTWWGPLVVSLTAFAFLLLGFAFLLD